MRFGTGGWGLWYLTSWVGERDSIMMLDAEAWAAENGAELP